MTNPPRNGEEGRSAQPRGGGGPAVSAPPIPVIAKILWSTGFLVGTISHALDISMFGWLPYEFMPFGFNLYWTSLVFLDPLAAVLIWLRPRWGLWLGCPIMASDLLVNAWTVFGAGYSELLPSLGFQAIFAAFVFYVAFGQKPPLHPKPESQ